MSRPPSPRLIALLFAVLCLVWGSTWYVIKVGLYDLPPITSAAARFALGFVTMLLLAPRLSRLEGGGPPPRWLPWVVGLTNFSVGYGIVYFVQTEVPSGLVSVMWGVFPLMMAVGAHRFLGETLRWRELIGMAIGFVGVAVLFLTDLEELGPDALSASAVLFLSPALAATGTILTKRYGSTSSSTLLNRDAMAIGAVALTAGAIAFERDQEIHVTTRAVFSVAYLGWFGTVVTFSLYFWLLRYARASMLSLIALITPCIALITGTVIGGEPFGVTTLIGSALVVSGVGVATVRVVRHEL